MLSPRPLALYQPLFTLEQKAVAPRKAVRTATGFGGGGGSRVDRLGRRWNPALHPRDANGRFIETGGVGRVFGRGLGKVVRAKGTKVEMQFGDGTRAVVPASSVSMVRRPDGTSPTMSRKKVVSEDEKREKAPERGTGVTDDDENPKLRLAEVPDDETPDLPDDEDDDEDGVDEAPAARRPNEAKVGDFAILNVGSRRKLVEVVAVDRNGRAMRYKEIGGTQPRPVPAEGVRLVPQDKVDGDKLRAAIMDYEGPDGPKTSFDSDEEASRLIGKHAADRKTRRAARSTAPAAAGPVDDARLPPGVTRGGKDQNGNRLPDSDGTIRLGSADTQSQNIPVQGQSRPAARPTPARSPGLPAAGSLDDGALQAERTRLDAQLAGMPEGDPAKRDLVRRLRSVKTEQNKRGQAQPAQQQQQQPAAPAPAAPTPSGFAPGDQVTMFPNVQAEVVGDDPDGRVRVRTANGSEQSVKPSALMKDEATPAPAQQAPQATPQAAPQAPPAPTPAPAAAPNREQSYRDRRDPLLSFTETGPGYDRGVHDALNTADRMHRAGNRDEERDYWLADAEANAARARRQQSDRAQDEAPAPAAPQATPQPPARSDGMGGNWSQLIGEMDDDELREVRNRTNDAASLKNDGDKDKDALQFRVEQADAELARRGADPALPVEPEVPARRAPSLLPGESVDLNEAARAAAERESAGPQVNLPGGTRRAAPAPETINPTPTSEENDSGDGSGVRGDSREVLADIPAGPVRVDPAAGAGAVLPREGARGRRDGGVPRGAERGSEPSGSAGEAGRPGAPDTDGDTAGGEGSPRRAGVPAEGARDARAGDAAPADTAQVAPPAPRFQPQGQGDLAPTDKAGRVAANIEAVRLRNKLKAEGRPATAQEQGVLARWGGWGAVPQFFTGSKSGDQYAAQRAELRELMTPEEWEFALDNTANAHYTDAAIVDEMWTALRGLGFDGGEVLEPGSGAGTFIGRGPRDARVTGVERDPVTADIAALLYPDANIRNEDFGETRVTEGMFDAAIGNVPFGLMRIYDKVFNKDRKDAIHNHFIHKALAGLKPGGVAAFITSSGTLDAPSSRDARTKMFAQADLLGAIRMPTGTHSTAADTEVVTDLLVFRKPMPGEDRLGDDWLTSSAGTQSDGSPLMSVGRDGVATPQSVSDYFQSRPENVLGEFKTGGWNGAAVAGDPARVPEQLRERLESLVEGARASDRVASKTPVVKPAAVKKRRAPVASQGAATTTVGGLFTGPSERTQARNAKGKVVGQITHTGATPVAGKKAGAEKSVEHKFTIVDLDGEEIEYEPAGSKSAGSRARGDDGRLSKPNQADELAALMRLRDVKADLNEAETETVEDTPEVLALRKQLNDLYDTYVKDYGPIGRRKVTLKEVPAPKLDDEGNLPDEAEDLIEDDGTWYRSSISTPGMGGIRSDPTWWSLVGLEKDYDESTNSAEKADQFTQRQIGRRDMPTSAETPDDALSISREYDGKIDLDRIASLLGVSPAEALQSLGDRVFKDHKTGELVPRNIYLSGAVREKRRELLEAVKTDPSLQRNLDAMTARVPADKDPTKITSRLGAPWISQDDFQQFVRDITGNQRAKVEKNKDDKWVVAVGSGGNRNPSLEGGKNMNDKRDIKDQTDSTGKPIPLLARWGTKRRNSYEIIETMMGQGRPRVTDTYVDSDGKKYEVFNEKETEAAIKKADLLAKEFSKWLWRDDARKERLQQAYNDRYRGYTDVNYVDSPARTYAGMSDDIVLDPHQNDAVTMSLDVPTIMLDHEVGTGKSYTMAAIIMEQKRLGKVNKPVMVVPNHLLEQAVREFKHLYPNARILATDVDGVTGDKRKRFVAQAGGSDWDVVLMTASSFTKIPLSQTKQLDNAKAELAEVQAKRERAIADGKTEEVKKWAIKVINAENKLKQLQDQLERDKGGLDFESIGFDYIVVDEAHEYKNDLVESSIDGLAKVKPKLAALDLREKLDYVREDAAKRGRTSVAVFATGTPVSNSSREFYVMARYLRPDLLKKAGINSFDEFAAQYLQVRESIEQSVSGKLQVKMREGDELVNTGELKRLWTQFADTVTAEDVGIVRPKLRGGSAEKIIGQLSPFQAQYVQSLGPRRDSIKPTRKPPKGADTVVAVGTDGLTSAVDLNLLSESKLAAAGIDKADLTVNDSKVPLIGAAVLDEWRRTKDMQFNMTAGKDSAVSPVLGAAQLVFADKGTPKGDQYSFYQSMKDYLVEGGMPAGEIAFIHDAVDAVTLGKMTEKVRQGQIKVLMVSTPKGGTGLNVQNRLTKLHHVDGAYRPDQIEQRNGRIIRRGNQMPDVGVAYYPLEGSTEGFQWAHTARKDNFLRQFAQADLDSTIVGRQDSETGSEADFLAAVSAKDPLVMDRVVVDKAFKSIEGDRDAATSAQEYHSDVVRKSGIAIRGIEKDIEDLQAAEDLRVDTAGDKFAYESVGYYGEPDGNPLKTRKEAAEAIGKVVADLGSSYNIPMGEGSPVAVGKLGGLTLYARTFKGLGRQSVEFLVQKPGGSRYSRELLNLGPAPTFDPNAKFDSNSVTRLENLVSGLTARQDVLRRNIVTRREQAGVSAVEADREFDRPEEFEALKDRKSKLDELMRMRASDSSKADDIARAQDDYDVATAKYTRIRDDRLNSGTAFQPSEMGEARTSRRKVKQQAAALERTQFNTPDRSIPKVRDLDTELAGAGTGGLAEAAPSADEQSIRVRTPKVRMTAEERDAMRADAGIDPASPPVPADAPAAATPDVDRSDEDRQAADGMPGTSAEATPDEATADEPADAPVSDQPESDAPTAPLEPDAVRADMEDFGADPDVLPDTTEPTNATTGLDADRTVDDREAVRTRLDDALGDLDTGEDARAPQDDAPPADAPAVDEPRADTAPESAPQDAPDRTYTQDEVEAAVGGYDGDNEGYRDASTTYTRQSVPLDSVTFEDGQKVGTDGEDPEDVARLREALDRGDSLPPVVLEDRGDGTYRWIDGQRRMAAMRGRGDSQVDAFVRPQQRDEQQSEIAPDEVSDTERDDALRALAEVEGPDAVEPTPEPEPVDEAPTVTLDPEQVETDLADIAPDAEPAAAPESAPTPDAVAPQPAPEVAAPAAPRAPGGKKKAPLKRDEVIFSEQYGSVSRAQLAAYRKYNVSPSDHNEIVDIFGEDEHAKITEAVKDPANRPEGSTSFSTFLLRRNQAAAAPEDAPKPVLLEQDEVNGDREAIDLPPAPERAPDEREQSDGDRRGDRDRDGADAGGAGGPGGPDVPTGGGLPDGQDDDGERADGPAGSDRDGDRRSGDRDGAGTPSAGLPDGMPGGRNSGNDGDRGSSPVDTPSEAVYGSGVPASDGTEPNGSSPVTSTPAVDDRPAPAAIAGEKFPPTRQQQDVYDAALDEKTIRVQAGAGAGKTSTLEGLARRIGERFPKKKIGYAAFNKALRDDQPVLTPDGWREIGTLKVGELVIGVDGKPYPIMAVTRRGVRPMNEVEFSDGTVVIADDEHLWMTQWIVRNPKQHRGGAPWEVRTTAEVARTLHRKHRVPHLQQPVDLPERALPLDPYLLGALIGDGSFKYTRVGFTCAEQDLVDLVTARLPLGHILRAVSGSSMDYNIVREDGSRGVRNSNAVMAALRALKLQGLGSRDKHIPAEYLLGSPKQRLALLRGLMDTDGCASGVRALFVTTSPQLAKDVSFLALSLGGVASIGHRSSTDSYCVNVRLQPNTCPFLMPRKASTWKPRMRDEQTARKITAIRPIAAAHATCISIDAPDHLFLTAGLIPTHNSIQAEAEGRMPRNTESRTGHSIGFNWVGKDLNSKMSPGRAKYAVRRPNEVARALGITRSLPGSDVEGGLSPTEQAQAAVATVAAYANSAEDAIDARHLPERLRLLPEASQQAVLAAARKAWADNQDPRGKLATNNDHFRKMWALSRPDFSQPGSGFRTPIDVLFVDEAQDTPPVLAKVYEDQAIQKVIVGDQDQSIYSSFTGAVDYLGVAKSDVELPLTKSWRYGPEIAAMGNRFLQLVGSAKRVEGGGKPGSVVGPGTMKGADAILVRSNGGMIAEIVRELDDGRLVGVPKNTKPGLLQLVETARYLKGERADAPDVLHEDLAQYRSWDEVVEAAAKGDDQGAASLEKLVRETGLDRLAEIVGSIVDPDEQALGGINIDDDGTQVILTGETGKLHSRLQDSYDGPELPEGRKTPGISRVRGFRWNPDVNGWTFKGTPAAREKALADLRVLDGRDTRIPDVTVSTVHKAKGLEWDRVRIGDDFRGPKVDRKTGEKTMPDAEEMRIGYVAVTRAGRELDPGSLAWIYAETGGEDGDTAVDAPEPAAAAVLLDPAEVRGDMGEVGADTEVLPDVQPAAAADAPVAPDLDTAAGEPAVPDVDVASGGEGTDSDATVGGEGAEPDVRLSDPDGAEPDAPVDGTPEPEEEPVAPQAQADPAADAVPDDPESTPDADPSPDVTTPEVDTDPGPGPRENDETPPRGSAPADPAAAEPAAADPDRPEPPGDFEGRSAAWVPAVALQPGDTARVKGISQQSQPIEAAGYVEDYPTQIAVSRRVGGRTRTSQMLQVTLTEKPDGSGERTTVLMPLNGIAARATNGTIAEPEAVGSPASLPEAAVLGDDVPESMPLDSQGAPIFPGSAVEVDGEPGTASAVTPDEVEVNRPNDKGREPTVRPSEVTVTESARPDGWTDDGTPEPEVAPVEPEQIVDTPEGRGVVSEVDGDEATVDLPDGSTVTVPTADVTPAEVPAAPIEPVGPQPGDAIPDTDKTPDQLDREADKLEDSADKADEVMGGTVTTPEQAEALEEGARRQRRQAAERRAEAARKRDEDAEAAAAAVEPEQTDGDAARQAAADAAAQAGSLDEAREAAAAALLPENTGPDRDGTLDPEREAVLDEINGAGPLPGESPEETVERVAEEIAPSPVGTPAPADAPAPAEGVPANRAERRQQAREQLRRERARAVDREVEGTVDGVQQELFDVLGGEDGDGMTPERIQELIDGAVKRARKGQGSQAKKIARAASGGRTPRPGIVALIAQILAALVRKLVALVRAGMRAWKGGSARPALTRTMRDARQRVSTWGEVGQLRRIVEREAARAEREVDVDGDTALDDLLDGRPVPAAPRERERAS